VIGLGLLIAASMGLIVYGFYAGFADRRETGTSIAATEAEGGTDLKLPLPSVCHIADMLADGRRLVIRTGHVIRTGPSDVCDRVFIIDTKLGTIVTTIRLEQ
jgi:hypothetical protein